ncbi:MAG: viroplasmin family protein [Bacteroidetes bacterium]|nr:viroplasmin family protein [Bacteroidota bacterium]
MAKQKYYVVWKGHQTGIFTSWPECEMHIKGFEAALYKSFESLETAEKAFKSKPHLYMGKPKSAKANTTAVSHRIITPSISVDAACAGNPGMMEYRCVDTATKEEIFHQGPFEQGTNNIGEFLALVHALAMLQKQNSALPVYSDSITAIAWVRGKKAKTKLEQIPQNDVLFDLIARAEKWLKENSWQNPILKWDTENWGEIPADFGRK